MRPILQPNQSETRWGNQVLCRRRRTAKALVATVLYTNRSRRQRWACHQRRWEEGRRRQWIITHTSYLQYNHMIVVRWCWTWWQHNTSVYYLNQPAIQFYLHRMYMHGGLVVSILLLNKMSYYHLSGAGATVHLQHPAEKRSTLGDCRFLLPKNPWASIGHISLSSFRPDSWLWLEWRQTDAGDTTQVSTFIYGQHIFPHKILTLSPSKITIPSAEFFTKDSFPLFSFRLTPPLFETRPGQNIAFNSGIWIASGKTKFSFEYCSQKSSKKFVRCDDQFF